MATSSLGRLTLDLAVRLSEFTDGMSRAERETQDRTQRMQESVTSFREHLANELGGTQIGGIFQSLNERFGELEGGIGKVSGALAGMAVGGVAIGLGALSKLAIETAKADAEMAAFANRANTSVQNFQTLAAASEGLGVNQEQLASILADTQEKLGEFTATQGGGAADFFNALRDNTKMTDDQIKQFGKTLSGKDGVEAIQLIKNKLDEVGASAQEQRFIFESLGSDLGNLSVIFANGGEILNQYRGALEEAGIIKTKEAIEQSQLLAAQTQSVHQRFNGFKSQLAGAMIPVLSSLAQYFLSSGKKGSALGGIIQGVGVLAKGAASIIMVFGGAIALLGDTIGQVMAQFGNVAVTGYDFIMADGLTAKMQVLKNGYATMKSLGSDWADSVINRFKSLDGAIGNVVNGQTAATDQLTQANIAIIRAQNQRTAGLKLDTKTAEDNRKELEKLRKEKEKSAKAGTVNTSSIVATAIRELGVNEYKNPNTVMGYQRAVGYMSKNIDAWCGSFVGASLVKSGFAIPKGGLAASARAWENYGTAINKNGIIPGGAIATVGRKGGSGRHVFIIEKDNGDGTVSTIEGNAGRNTDRVIRGTRSKSSLVAVRMPVGANGKIASTALDADYVKNQESIGATLDKIEQDRQRDAEKAAEEHQRNMQSIVQKYATKDESIEAEHTKNLELINKTYAKKTAEWTKYTKAENQRYYDEMYEYTTSVALKYATEEEKIDIEHYKKLREIKRDFVNDPTERDRRIALENESYQKDVANFKWAQGEKARAQKALIDKLNDDMNKSVMQSTNDYLDATMKASMTPDQYAKWSLQRDYNNSYTSLYGQYQNRQDEINAKDDRGNFKIDDESERNALLEAARQEHLARLYVMESDHATKVKELDKQVNDAKAQQTSAAFGVMTSAMSAFFGQQSIAYKMAANAEKGYALYQAWLNSKKAVLAAYADTPGSVWAKMGAAGKAAIDTGLMTAAIQAISPRGFSSGGYTGNYGINDIAGVVHGQEYVLNAMATKRIGVDSLNALNRGDSIGGHNISVNVVVNSDGSGSVDSNAQVGKQMGDAIKAAVLKTLMQEKRQGGLLAR